MKKLPKNAVLIGRGMLSWPREERISDRYGLISLYQDSEQLELGCPEDDSGSLIAVVTDSKPSPHIGDCFRGLTPRQPSNGDIVVLGTGKVIGDPLHIGLQPDDGRESDWLNPRALYDVHGSIVELYFAP